jgi:hypothetical protein
VRACRAEVLAKARARTQQLAAGQTTVVLAASR